MDQADHRPAGWRHQIDDIQAQIVADHHRGEKFQRDGQVNTARFDVTAHPLA